MKTKRTLTIEIDRVRITTSHVHKHAAWCELCRSESEFVEHSEAAEIAKMIRAQGLAMNKEDLHFYQPTGEQMLVCLNSIVKETIPKFIKNQE